MARRGDDIVRQFEAYTAGLRAQLAAHQRSLQEDLAAIRNPQANRVHLAPDPAPALLPETNAQLVQRLSNATGLNDYNRENLDLSKKKLDDPLIKFLSTILAETSKIQSLNLSGNQIGAEGTSALCAVLCLNTTVVSVNLSRNLIGEEGIPFILELIQKNSTIRTLSLRKNNFQLAGIKLILKVLENNTSITQFFLSDGVQPHHQMAPSPLSTSKPNDFGQEEKEIVERINQICIRNIKSLRAKIDALLPDPMPVKEIIFGYLSWQTTRPKKTYVDFIVDKYIALHGKDVFKDAFKKK